jgi:hypothetical protein
MRAAVDRPQQNLDQGSRPGPAGHDTEPPTIHALRIQVPSGKEF